MTIYFDKTAEFELEIADFTGANILQDKSIRRLKGLKFLGVLDYSVNVPSKRSYSRYDHTISVAYLTLRYCRNLSLSYSDTLLAVLSAMIHDTGHLAFSHSSERLLFLRGGYEYSHHSNLKLTKVKATMTAFYEGLPQHAKREYSSADELSAAAISLLSGGNKEVSLGKIASMFNNGFCPDTFDGVERAYWSLEKILKSDPIDPLEIVNEVSMEGEPLVFRSAKTPDKSHVLERFHKHTRDLYRKVIYNRERMAAEAMLTRALEYTYSDKRHVRHTHQTDVQVIRHINEKAFSKQLFALVKRGDLFAPLSQAEPSLFRRANVEFDKALRSKQSWGKSFTNFRRRIEEELSSLIGIPSKYVIPHVFIQLVWDRRNVNFPFYRSRDNDGDLRRVEWTMAEGKPIASRASSKKLEIYIPTDSMIKNLLN